MIANRNGTPHDAIKKYRFYNYVTVWFVPISKILIMIFIIVSWKIWVYVYNSSIV